MGGLRVAVDFTLNHRVLVVRLITSGVLARVFRQMNHTSRIIILYNAFQHQLAPQVPLESTHELRQDLLAVRVQFRAVIGEVVCGMRVGSEQVVVYIGAAIT